MKRLDHSGSSASAFACPYVREGLLCLHKCRPPDLPLLSPVSPGNITFVRSWARSRQQVTSSADCVASLVVFVFEIRELVVDSPPLSSMLLPPGRATPASPAPHSILSPPARPAPGRGLVRAEGAASAPCQPPRTAASVPTSAPLSAPPAPCQRRRV
jgi:hypothetical protein